MTASTIISLISAAFTVIRWLVTYAQKREWMEQGAAQIILKSLQESDDAISRAKTARDLVRINNARDPASVLRDDDGFKRPGD